mgnify:CR=1 FL=1
MSKQKKHILILDGDQFSTLAIVRSLGRKGLMITVAAVEDNAICRHSKYTHNFFTYPNPLINTDDFYKSILDRLNINTYELVIPVTELTTLPLAKIRKQIEQKTILAVADDSALEQVTDKAQTFKLAKELGVPVPISYTITNHQELKNCIEHIHYPIVLKPSRSITNPANDIRAKLTVDYAFSKEELQKKVISLLKNSEIILQEYFEGTGVGIELIADQGKIIHAFQHQRQHELPLTGGGSCLRKSVAINPTLLKYSQDLIKALNWHGVAMVEFKYNETNNQSCLMEINGRFWGSLPLAVSSGSDFPWYLYQLLIDNKHPEQFQSEIGHFSRKIQEDLYWYIQVIFRRDNSPLIKWPKKSLLIKDFFSIFHYKHHFDAFYYQDMKPGFVELANTVSWFYNFSYDFINKKKLYKKHLRIKQSQALKKPLLKSKSVLFLCYGNINRSAAAECIYLQQNDTATLNIQSAGFHPINNRPADPNMIKIAQENNINMTNCSSSMVNTAMLETADIIFAMEIEHLIRLKTEYPQFSEKAYLLGSLNPDHKASLEIDDPYGNSLDEYRNCFKQIQSSVKKITEIC